MLLVFLGKILKDIASTMSYNFENMLTENAEKKTMSIIEFLSTNGIHVHMEVAHLLFCDDLVEVS